MPEHHTQLIKKTVTRGIKWQQVDATPEVKPDDVVVVVVDVSRWPGPATAVPMGPHTANPVVHPDERSLRRDVIVTTHARVYIDFVAARDQVNRWLRHFIGDRPRRIYLKEV